MQSCWLSPRMDLLHDAVSALLVLPKVFQMRKLPKVELPADTIADILPKEAIARGRA